MIGIFGIVPLIIILLYSFLTPGAYGGVVWEFSTAAYVQFLFEKDLFDESYHFTTAYFEIFSRSIGLAAFTTIGSLILGFPTAYFMATRPPHQRNFWLFLITLPFWSNLLIRTFAIFVLIRDDGIVNNALLDIGILSTPFQIMYTDTAVGIALLYGFLPFMVLPIYASLEKLDFRYVEAAYDLYATRWHVLWRIIVPLSKPGIVAGCLLVFIPALGAYVTPTAGGRRQVADDRQPDRPAVRGLAQLAVWLGGVADPDGPGHGRALCLCALRHAQIGHRPWLISLSSPAGALPRASSISSESMASAPSPRLVWYCSMRRS